MFVLFRTLFVLCTDAWCEIHSTISFAAEASTRLQKNMYTQSVYRFALILNLLKKRMVKAHGKQRGLTVR